MKKLSIICMAIIFLTGCSVSIEEADKEAIEAFYEQQANMRKKSVVLLDDPVQPPNEYFLNQLSTIREVDFSTVKLDDARNISYVAFGDSLTRGIGDERLKYGYTERLATALEKWPAIVEVELDNRGKNGRRSDQLLALLKKGHYDDILPTADFITMTLGGNDVMKIVKKDLFNMKKREFDKERKKFMTRYEEIVTSIRESNPYAPLIMIGFYNPFSIVTDEETDFEQIISEWNASIEQLASETANACFVPVDDLFVSNDDLIYHTDYFHPNAEGYERMTARVIETMQSCDISAMSAGLLGFEVAQNE